MTDLVSALMRLLTSSLGALHPMRLFLGISLGLASKIVVNVAAKTFPVNVPLQALDGFQAHWYILVVAPWLFAPIIFRKRAPEAAIHQAATLQVLVDQAKFTDIQKRMFWHSLIEKYLRAAQPDLSKQPDINLFAGEAMSELKEQSQE